MIRNARRHIIFTSLLLGCTSAAYANRYSIVDLGSYESPVAINRVNAVAANLVSRGRGQLYRNGVWRNFPPGTQVFGTNRASDVVGVDSEDRPTFWQHNSDAVTIPLPNGAIFGHATSVSNIEEVVGWYDAQSGFPQCFSWTPDGGVVDIGSGDWESCSAYGVNEAGQLVGVVSNSGEEAFIWAKGQFTPLGFLPGTGSSVGYAINEAGEAVGDSYSGTSRTAFIWNGEMNSLDPSNQFTNSVAMAINNKAEVVGWAQQFKAHNPSAVRFAHGKVLKLASEVVEVGDWNLQKATAINDRGVIVGVGVHSSNPGIVHGFMLVPE